jgi:hypothetical protein
LINPNFDCTTAKVLKQYVDPLKNDEDAYNVECFKLPGWCITVDSAPKCKFSLEILGHSCVTAKRVGKCNDEGKCYASNFKMI